MATKKATSKKTAPKKTVQELLLEAEQQSQDAVKRIADLKKQRLEELTEQKVKLEQELSAISKEMSELNGKPAKKPRKTRNRATKEEKASLLDAVQNALKGKNGMKVKDIILAVKESGFAVDGDNFYTSVAALLSKDEEHFVKVDRGVYKLKG